MFVEIYADLMGRMGFTEPTNYCNPKDLDRMWTQQRSMYEHLALTADEFWVAELDGESTGFARLIQDGNVCQVTEFFVKPVMQSAGVGRRLQSITFRCVDEKVRTIFASPDECALSKYLKPGFA